MDLRRDQTFKAVFPPRLGQWLGPLLVVGAVAGLLAAIVIGTGSVNLAADIPHPEGWAQLLHYTFGRSVAAHSDAGDVPADLAQIPTVKGAIMFDKVCANCHGVPGRGQSPIALSMRPQPQYLPGVVGQYRPEQLFWIVKHGIKYSAMPAFPTPFRDDEVWSMVAFLQTLPRLDPVAYHAMTAEPAAPTTAAPVAIAAAKPRAAGFRGESNDAVPAVGFAGERINGDPAAACTICHGSDGLTPRAGGIPVLGLLNPETIRAALTAYAAGTRHSGYMQPIASQLSAEQIETLARSLGGHRPDRPSPTPAPHDTTRLARGERIAMAGAASAKVTPCEECHAINRATRKFYPAIEGQDWRYLRDQLRLYRAGVRHADSPVRPMVAVAHRLTDADIDAVAAWYATRTPAAPAPVATGPVAATAGSAHHG